MKRACVHEQEGNQTCHFLLKLLIFMSSDYKFYGVFTKSRWREQPKESLLTTFYIDENEAFEVFTSCHTEKSIIILTILLADFGARY